MCFLIGSKLSRDRAVKLHISRPSAWFSSYYIVCVFSRNIVLVCWTKTPESSRCHNSLVYVTKLMIMCRILKFFLPLFQRFSLFWYIKQFIAWMFGKHEDLFSQEISYSPRAMIFLGWISLHISLTIMQ